MGHINGLIRIHLWLTSFLRSPSNWSAQKQKFSIRVERHAGRRSPVGARVGWNWVLLGVEQPLRCLQPDEYDGGSCAPPSDQIAWTVVDGGPGQAQDSRTSHVFVELRPFWSGPE